MTFVSPSKKDTHGAFPDPIKKTFDADKTKNRDSNPRPLAHKARTQPLGHKNSNKSAARLMSTSPYVSVKQISYVSSAPMAQW
jgi:hypothetical protein